MHRIYHLLNKSAFPDVISVEHEQKKLAILRWILGLIVFYRFAQVVFASRYITEYAGATYLGVISLVVVALFTIGFASPIITFLMMFNIMMFDHLFWVGTLGSSILSQFIFVLFLANHGRYYSVDNWLLKQQNILGKLFRWLYSIPGTPSPQQLKLYYFLGFFSYAVVSFCALSFHVFDENWIHGRTAFMFFPAAFLSKYYVVFREIILSWPGLFMAFSIFSIIGQSIFQFLMLPLMWYSWGKKFVLFWGFSFFVSCLFFVNLSYLPHIEVLAWLAFFTRTRTRESIIMMFDDRCNLCKRSIRVLRWTNFNGVLEFLPLSKSGELLEKFKLDRDEVRVWLYGIEGNRVYKGYDLYMEVVRRNPLLWIVWPFFILGKYTRLGYKMYAWIASNRYKLFGTCEITYPKPPYEPEIKLTRAFWAKATVWLYAGMASVFLLTQMPYMVSEVPALFKKAGIGKVYGFINRSVYWFGYDTPIVFNETDLKLNEKYFVLYHITDEGEQLVPIIDERGGRLSYLGNDYLFFTNHGSDLLYFCTTMHYMRGFIHSTDEEFHLPGYMGDKVIRRLIEFDVRYRKLNGPQHYRVRIHHNQCIDGQDLKTKFNDEVTSTFDFSYTP